MNSILLIIIILFILLLFKKNNNTIEKLININNDTDNYKYVCMYAYYEKNDKYKNNLNFFINNGILDDILYYIIINGYKCSVNIPNKKNIIVIYRDNTGYDFGAWAYCIEKYLKHKYEYYIFINTSVIGPIINKNNNWLNEFLKLFNSKDVKLVGTSINIFDYSILKYYYTNFEKSNIIFSYVQSMFFILNYEGFNHLLNHNLFNFDKISKYSFIEVVLNCEVKMSQIIINNNWNINCILPKYKNLDYRSIYKNINPSNIDPYRVNAYFGKTIKPEEVIFFKNNRF